MYKWIWKANFWLTWCNWKSYLVTLVIEKIFDSLNHSFLLTPFFRSNFVDWIKRVFNDQESCVINRGVITQYFRLEEGAWHGDPISVYLFILCIEIIFTVVKNNKQIKSQNILGNTFLYNIGILSFSSLKWKCHYPTCQFFLFIYLFIYFFRFCKRVCLLLKESTETAFGCFFSRNRNNDIS